MTDVGLCIPTKKKKKQKKNILGHLSTDLKVYLGHQKSDRLGWRWKQLIMTHIYVIC